MTVQILRRIFGRVATAAAIAGPFLPWTRSTSPAEAVYDLLFSQVSRPNWEWCIWFAAPLWAGLQAMVDLRRQGRLSRRVLIPGGIFLVAWATLLLTGYRAYTGFHRPGFVIAFAGVIGLSVLSCLRPPPDDRSTPGDPAAS